MKNTVATLLEMKKNGEKINQLTCYDFTTASIMDEYVDTILVGDSLGMVMQGYNDTLPITVDDMIVYGRSVARACKHALVVLDMPFMSYQISPAQALENAGRMMKEAGVAAVKLEGGKSVCPQIKAITDAGIPVVAHIGMTPQSVNAFGGFKVQGKGEANARRVLEDALAVQEAGAFAVTLECIPPKLAALITKKLDIITIGIGASAECDGQVLVYQDMLGLTGRAPKFVKQYGNVAEEMRNAFSQYRDEVKNKQFPTAEQTYAKSDCEDEFYAALDKEFD